MKLIWRLAISCLLLFALTPTVRQVSAQQEDATTDNQNSAEAEALWAQLSPEERVGQLFVVSFYGSEITPDAPVIDLIQNYHIGGVILQAANDNINAAAAAPAAVRQLVTDLQSWALLLPDPDAPIASGEGSPTPEPTLPRVNALPLFIALAQPGDGYPNDQILQGLTPLPNQLALGATWQPALSRQVGGVLGAELSALGVNLLLGPSLDVATTPAGAPNPNISQSFGGHPYWVSQLSQAYVSGVQEGSGGRLLVVPGRLPGQGASDRPVEQEVATVRKTLAELIATDLLPYLSLTATADPAHQPDGLQLSHLRYQGFQGNVTSATLPLGFDSAAVEELLGLAPMQSWRQAGGLLLSGPLGSQAVERLYDPQGNEFPHRVVAKDAFLAGSDLLLLDSFALGRNNAAAEYANIQDTILWFQERYATDPSFQQQVDQAVVRILQQKIELYGGDFQPSNVFPGNRPEVGQQSTIPFNVAQNAITLVAPDPAELNLQLPGPPAATDRIVVFSDVRPATQCSTCPEFAQLGLTSLQDRLLELYGPFASGQLQLEQISSFTLADLNTYLNAAGAPITLPEPTPTATPFPEATATPENVSTATPFPTATPLPEFLVQEALGEATWIIFALRDNAVPGASADVVSRFLAERPDLVQANTVIALAFDAPIYLDTTEISQLSAYFAVYSQADAFLDASVRVLFQELQPRGALPIDVPAVGYQIAEVTQPTANQIIPLLIEQAGTLISPASDEPLEVKVGDTLRLTTGVILDKNGFPVPDGTIVAFIQQDRVQGFFNEIGQSQTIGGVARFDYFLEARTGQFRISVQAGDAERSDALDLDIDSETSGEAVVVTLPPLPTAAPTATATPSLTPTATPTATPTVTPTATPLQPIPPEAVSIPLTRLWMFSSMLAGLLFVGTITTVISRHEGKGISRQIRWVLLTLVSGLLLYNWYLLGLPFPVRHFWDQIGGWTPPALLTIGGGLSLLVLWWQQARR